MRTLALWGWSRHPNYFFEFLGWCAYPLLAISVGWPAGWLALTGPIFMFWLLRYVSGVPPLEATMLASRGDRFSRLSGAGQRLRSLAPEEMTDMLSNLATLAAERLDLPDAATRAAINLMVSRTAREIVGGRAVGRRLRRRHAVPPHCRAHAGSERAAL